MRETCTYAAQGSCEQNPFVVNALTVCRPDKANKFIAQFKSLHVLMKALVCECESKSQNDSHTGSAHQQMKRFRPSSHPVCA